MKQLLHSKKVILLAILSGLNLSAIAQSTIFNYTGGIVSYTVPAGVTTLNITANGAQGGNQTATPASGGLGAIMFGNFIVTPGHVLNVLVGEQPASGTLTGGGGGGSFVWDVTSGNLLLIAAGGGGGAGYQEISNDGINAVTTNDGTNGGGGVAFGGGGTGGNGGTAPVGTCFGKYGAGGAGWFSNGADGNGGGCSTAGGGNTPLSGGAGGAFGGTAGFNGPGGFGGGGGSQGQCLWSGGGGGGGYSGGGGGDYTCSGSTGADPGGGGGSYNIGSNQSNSIGNTGNGIVTICAFPAPGVITGNTNVCIGASTPLADAGGAPGGTWSSSDITIATVGFVSGLVTGVAAGTVTITYTTPANDCGASLATTTVTVNPLPNVDTVTGGGSFCAGDTGVHVGLNTSTIGVDYRLYNGISTVGAAMAGTGASIDFGLQTVAGSYTVVATDTATMCVSNMFGSVPVIINPLPVAYTVTGGGNYCAGGTGVHVGLSRSDTSINYQLYRGASPVGSPLPGTGVSLDFGLQTAPGAYTVVATNTKTGCIGNMAGSVVVGINPLPVIFMVTGGGSYCAGGTGLHINLSGSDSGISYQLFNGTSPVGAPMGGSGSSLDFGLHTAAGTYTVVATNTTTTCTNNMMDSATIVINPLPNVYTVTGGGSYCAGGAGVSIGLDTSNAGFSYQLYHGVTASGAPLAGIDTALNFGLDTAAGSYSVVATDTLTGCTAMMDGSATVTIIPLVYPAVSITRSTSDTICAGTHTTFTISSVTEGGSSPHYLWKVNGSTVGTDSVAYNYVPTTGNRVNVLLVSSAVCATPDTVSSDTLTMIVFPNGTPAVHIAASPADTVCESTGVTITATPAFGGYTPTYTWIKNTVVVSSAPVFSYIPIDGDNLYCIMNSNYMCRLATTAYSNAIIMSVEAPVIPSVTISGKPGMTISPNTPDTLIATAINAGSSPSYQWYLNAAIVPGATSNIYIRDSFMNKDSVSCMVTRNDVCHISTINSVVLRVYRVDVPMLAGNNEVILSPNPNKGTFTIKGSLFPVTIGIDEEVTVEITNMLGQSVYKNAFMTHNGNIDEQVQTGNTLPGGVYILTLHSSNGNRVFHFVIGQ